MNAIRSSPVLVSAEAVLVWWLPTHHSAVASGNAVAWSSCAHFPRQCTVRPYPSASQDMAGLQEPEGSSHESCTAV